MNSDVQRENQELAEQKERAQKARLTASMPRPGYSWNPLITSYPRNRKCFCGSGKKFKLCHLPTLPRVVSSELAKDLWEEIAKLKLEGGQK